MELMALTLWAGEGSAISGPPAAALHGLHGFAKRPLEIATMQPKRGHGLDAVVRRLDRYLEQDIVVVDSIPVMSIPRLLLDLSGRRHGRVGRGMDDALLKKLTTIDELALYFEQSWLRGRRGIRIFRNHVSERLPGESPMHSDLEAMFWRFVKERELPRPVKQWSLQLPTRLIHVDFGYPWRPLGIEVDSTGWHLNREAFEADRLRDIEAQSIGVPIIRVTYAMMRFDGDALEARIREMLALPPR
jgi:hypothetical protein